MLNIIKEIIVEVVEVKGDMERAGIRIGRLDSIIEKIH